ncbi:putative viral A-type inclusion protein repeat family [Neospora caninum Liverpool]|uniref:Putative viral A-type inclusion protein repeat family n=1 Tax=Neospora caninum (strain Liverpool) TaxID=572307 RepID=F0VEH0_NEOCL|nr:putative viral A-type inclusion protein repeat family [Neospora caninum Liverpool]CBZ52114.1 putative viral A-type inclusion protein repeat family [Neospora caninum Liverpool]CEL66076.1 TPA: viral A-type inclusion protein repeat family,putative [Neospora caninum Liverpool]|eukprot:XP_003882146.1 putative viral A-type inclusion protein repeat family [Neospora caninum Liverpool]
MQPQLLPTEQGEHAEDTSLRASAQETAARNTVVEPHGPSDSSRMPAESSGRSVGVSGLGESWRESRAPESSRPLSTSQRLEGETQNAPLSPVSLYSPTTKPFLVSGTVAPEAERAGETDNEALFQAEPQNGPGEVPFPDVPSSFRRDTENQRVPYFARRLSTVVSERTPLAALVAREGGSPVRLPGPPHIPGTQRTAPAEASPLRRSVLPGKAEGRAAPSASAKLADGRVAQVPARDIDAHREVATRRLAPQPAPWRVDQESEEYPGEPSSGEHRDRAARSQLVSPTAFRGMPPQPLAGQTYPQPCPETAPAFAGVFEPLAGGDRGEQEVLSPRDPQPPAVAAQTQEATPPPTAPSAPSGETVSGKEPRPVETRAAPAASPRPSAQVEISPAETHPDKQFPSSAPPGLLGVPVGFSPFQGPRGCLRAPYVAGEELSPAGTCCGGHRTCLIGPQRASPARRASWWGLSGQDDEPRPLSAYWRERGRRWRYWNATASEEAALRTRPPRGTEQMLAVSSRRPWHAALSPTAGLRGAVHRLENAAGSGSRTASPGMAHVLSPQQPQRPDDRVLALAEARESIHELETVLAEQEVRHCGENMLKEGCIAYQDESIRLLKAQVKQLSEDLECYASSNAFCRKETVSLLRNLRALRGARGERQGSIVGLQILYSKLEAARNRRGATQLPTGDYLLHQVPATPFADQQPRQPLPVDAPSGENCAYPHARAPAETHLSAPSSSPPPPPPSEPADSQGEVFRSPLDAPAQHLCASARLAQEEPYPPRSPEGARVSVATSVTGLPQSAPPPRPEVAEAATEMSEAGFDELLGEREEKRKRAEEERKWLEMEVQVLQQQMEILLEHERQEEEKVRQQQGQLGLLRQQEQLLRAQAEEQENLQKQIVARLQAEAMDQAMRERRREELRQLVQETTTPFPFAPDASRRSRALSPGSPGVETLPQSPLPRTSSPSPVPALAGGVQRCLSPSHAGWDARGRSPSPTPLLLSREEVEEREDLRRVNEVLQKKCTELHGQVTFLQMAGAGLSKEQLDYLETQVAEQKAYAKALEQQNRELVEMAEKALNEQNDALEKEWGGRLKAIEEERGQAIDALRRDGEAARQTAIELERKLETAERTKDDALSRLVMCENQTEEAEERVKAREEEVAALQRNLAELEKQMDVVRMNGNKGTEELRLQLEERERQVFSLEQSAGAAEQEIEKLRTELNGLRKEQESTKSLMRSQVASLAQQMERDQKEKEDVITLITSETESLQTQVSEAAANYQALEEKWKEQQARVKTLEAEKKDLEAAYAHLKEETRQLQESEQELRREFSKALPEDAKDSLQKLLADTEKQLGESRLRVSALEKDLADSQQDCTKALEALVAEQKSRQEAEKKYEAELEKLREKERQTESTIQGYISGLQKAKDESMKIREETEKTVKENEEKYAKLSELTAKQHFERERMLQKHLQEKDALKQSLARMVEETSELQKRFEHELRNRDDGYRKELEDSHEKLQEMLRQANEQVETTLSQKAALEKTLREEMENVKKQHESELAQLRESLQKEVDQNKKALTLQKSLSIDGMKRRHEQELASIRADSETALSAAKQEFESASAAQEEKFRAAIQAVKKECEETLKKEAVAKEELKKRHAAEVDMLSQAQLGKIEQQRQRSEQVIEELKKRHAVELEEMKERLAKSTQDYTALVQQQREDAEKAVAGAKKAHLEEIEKLKSRFKQQEETLKRELARSIQDLQVERGLRGDHSDRFRQLLQDRVTNLQREIDSVSVKLEEFRDKSAALESEKESLLKVNEDLERQTQRMVEERRRTVDGTQRLEALLIEMQALASVNEAKATQLAKALEAREKTLAELREELEKGKSEAAKKDERLKKSLEAARLVKNQEMKHRDIASSLKKQLEAKEKTLADLEDEMDHLQEMLRTKDQNDLETLSSLKRRSTELEFDLQDAQRENAQLKRARETLERERRISADAIRKLQEEIKQLSAAAKTSHDDPEKERLGGHLADLEKQVEDLEFQVDEHAHAEAKIRAEAKHFEEEATRKSREIEKLKKDLSVTRAKVAEANGRVRQSLAEFTRQQEELRNRLTREFARKEEELQAKYQNSLASEDRTRDDSRIRELEAIVARLSTAPGCPLSVAMIAEIKSYLRHAADTLLTLSTAFGDGEAIGVLFTQMHPILSAKEVSEFLLQLAPCTPASVLEKLVERLEPATEARTLWEKMQQETPFLRLSTEAVQLASSIRSQFRGVRSSGGAGGRVSGTSATTPSGTGNGSGDTHEQILRFFAIAPPLESLHLLKSVGEGLGASEVVSLLASLLPVVPRASVASVATALFHDDTPVKVGDSLGQDFAEFLMEFTYAHQFADLLQLIGDAIKQLRAIYASTANLSAATARDTVMPPLGAFGAPDSALPPGLPQCYATPHTPYFPVYQHPAGAGLPPHRADALPAVTFGRNAETVEYSRPPGPRVFNVSAKLSYKLLTQKQAAKKERASARVEEPSQRILSDSSTN